MALSINDICEPDSMKLMTLVAGWKGTGRAVCSVGIADYEFTQSNFTFTETDEFAFECDSLVISSLLFAENPPENILPVIQYSYRTGVAGFAKRPSSMTIFRRRCSTLPTSTILPSITLEEISFLKM